MKKPLPRSKKERLMEILAQLGEGIITKERYREMMAEQNLTEEDVDRFCRDELE